MMLKVGSTICMPMKYKTNMGQDYYPVDPDNWREYYCLTNKGKLMALSPIHGIWYESDKPFEFIETESETFNTISEAKEFCSLHGGHYETFIDDNLNHTYTVFYSKVVENEQQSEKAL